MLPMTFNNPEGVQGGGRHSVLQGIRWDRSSDSWMLLGTATATAKSLQSCPTLCDPIDGSPLGFPVPGILQVRTLEWAAFPSPMHESEK